MHDVVIHSLIMCIYVCMHEVVIRSLIMSKCDVTHSFILYITYVSKLDILFCRVETKGSQGHGEHGERFRVRAQLVLIV